jgi:hypothetical protein
MKATMTALLALVLGATPLWAVLGEQVESVNSDQKVMRGEVRAFALQGYSIQQVTGADRTVVKEYVTPTGMVFGISWRGPVMPNLRELLGSYFAQFQQAAQSRVRRRGPLVLRTDQFVVESGGHLRSFQGRAYVPSLLPKNVPAEVVR